MILEDLKGFLNANSIAPVYLSFEPPTSGITLYLYAGKQADPWNPSYHYYNLQVISRYTDFPTSQTFIRQVQNVLTNLAGIVGSSDIVNCYPKQDPYQIGYDEQKQARLIQNYEIEAREDTGIPTSGYYVNGSYLVNWDNIYNTPTTLSGYGITDGGGSSGVPNTRTLTINGTIFDLSANRTWSVGDVFTTSAYTNPAWLVSLPWTKITNTPTTLAGYGITDSIVFESRLLTINGLTQSLAADRTWNVGNIYTYSGYVDPSWITSIDWGKITGEPSTLAGYGITDAVPNNRVITINGLSHDLSTNRSWDVGNVFTYSGYNNPSWIVSLDYSKLLNVPATSGTGTVYYVGLSAPSIFNVANTPIVSSGTFNVTLINQNANTVFSGPTTGSPDIPAFRSLVTADLPTHFHNWNQITNTPHTLSGYGIVDAVWISGAYSNPAWLTSLAWSKITGTPTTLAGYGITDPVVLNTRTITINGLEQDLSANRIWNVGNVFTTSSYNDPSWLVTLDWSKIVNEPTTIAGYGITDAYTKVESDNRFAHISISGTLRYVGLSLPSIFTVNNTPLIGPGGTLSGVLNSQTQNTFFSSPNGIDGIPTFRTIVAADIPSAVFNTRTITINGLSQDLSADRTWNVGNVFTTSSYVNPDWLVSIPWSKIINTPTTLLGYGITDAFTKTESDARFSPIVYSGTVRYVGLDLPSSIFDVSNSPILSSGTITATLDNQTVNTVFSGPSTGSPAQPTFRLLVPDDIPNLPWSIITSTPTTLAGYGITDAAHISISGTLRTVGLALPSIFTVNNTPLTGPGGTISGVFNTQASGTFFAGPTTGSAAIPTFRTLVLADLPNIPFAAITTKPTTLAGYGIADAYTMVQSDGRYIPSGLLPPLAMYWTASGQIYFVAHSGMALGFPYLAGSGTLVYERAFAANQTSFSAFSFPLYLTFNDIFRVTCSANIGTFRSATFPRIA